jgi:hypothetical protein
MHPFVGNQAEVNIKSVGHWANRCEAYDFYFLFMDFGAMSAFGSKADFIRGNRMSANDPNPTYSPMKFQLDYGPISFRGCV